MVPPEIGVSGAVILRREIEMSINKALVGSRFPLSHLSSHLSLPEVLLSRKGASYYRELGLP
jgi:hypothetical protein